MKIKADRRKRISYPIRRKETNPPRTRKRPLQAEGRIQNKRQDAFCIGWNRYTIDEYMYSLMHFGGLNHQYIREPSHGRQTDMIERHAYDKTDRVHTLNRQNTQTEQTKTL